MAGTRTAPAATATANARQVTFRLVDASGDLTAVNMQVPVATTAAAIEAWAAAYAAGTQSSLYAIEDNSIRSGSAEPSNAEAGSRDSVKDGVNLAFRNPTTLLSFGQRLVAPDPATMDGDNDIPVMSGLIGALITAIQTIQAGYSDVTAQYTERRERKNNPKIRT